MTDEERAANVALNVVKEGGGYVTFDQFDHIYARKMRFMPWLAGWGSMDGLTHNNGVLSAQEAVQMKLIFTDGEGYGVEQE